MKRAENVKKRTLFLTGSAAIAAIYVILTLLSGLLGLDGKNVIQVRISEALCVLPYYTAFAVPGVTVGCLIYNLLFASPIDAVFGTLATLIGALCTRYIPLFRKNIFLASIPTVVSNSVIIPFVIAYAYMDGAFSSIPFYMLTVAIGEIISCTVLGTCLLLALKKHRNVFFGGDK